MLRLRVMRVVPGFIPKERARIDAGYTIVEREDMENVGLEEEMAGLLGAYATGPGSVVAAPSCGSCCSCCCSG
jgi:hypothetical protein